MIHHVQLACPPGSEDVLRAFYVGVLGLAEKPKPPALAARGGCWFSGYGIELHLGVEGGPAAGDRAGDDTRDGDTGGGGAGGDTGGGAGGDDPADAFRPARKAHPGLLWPDLDDLAARLVAAGYAVRWAADGEIPGVRRFHTEDPHGNRIEFLAFDATG